ncbi:general transcription factor IIF subunit 1-like [Physella acuta]|uniref:general transcription factor IIF subunit 1-like n=1 Tax=Physella acuta TaxID=109671 RepID=UPI0027DC7736|nr:general transcription factor IIF subunit 1-like [Physella acuta]
MASYQPSGSGSAATPADEFTVRIPRDTRRKFTMMKFGTGSSVDFSKLGDQPVKIERENNLKEYKTANDLDMLPKFGAGSEYGRDQKEESRRKKYGIMLKKYNPDDQPWLLKIGGGKQTKRFKGVREGTITENTSYYIFTKASDGAFEAFPVEEWYNFTPMVRYKYLNSEEAEEEYSRRDKTLNYFSIMVKKRIKKEEDHVDEDEDGKKGGKKSKKKDKDLILTDKDDWDDMEMSDDDEDEKEGDEDGNKVKKKQHKGAKKAVKNSKKNSDDEAVEESDEGDFDDREVDYMSDSGSSSSLSGQEEDAKEKKYDEKGVDQEAGLRNILDSDAEEEEEEEKEKEEIEEEIEDKEEKKEEKKKGDDDSSSSSSEDDSDIEKDAKLASAIFLQGGKKEKKEKKEKADTAATDTNQAVNRTPTPDKLKEKAMKRKAEAVDGKAHISKKHKVEDSEGISEDAIRRYLMRKPMTTKDLLQKFKSKKLNMTNEKITHVIAQLLKKINPDKMTINKKLYLSLKKPE